MSKAQYTFLLTLYRAMMMVAKGLKTYLDAIAARDPDLMSEE